MSDQFSRRKSYRWVSASQASYDGSEWDSDEGGIEDSGHRSVLKEKVEEEEEDGPESEGDDTFVKLPTLPKLNYEEETKPEVVNNEEADEVEELPEHVDERVEPEVVGGLPKLPGDPRIRSFAGEDAIDNYMENGTEEEEDSDDSNVSNEDRELVPKPEITVSREGSLPRKMSPVNEDLENLMVQISREMGQEDLPSYLKEDEDNLHASIAGIDLNENPGDEHLQSEESPRNAQRDSGLGQYSPDLLERSALGSSLSYSHSSRETGRAEDTPGEEHLISSPLHSPSMPASRSRAMSPDSGGSLLEDSEEDDALSFTESLNYHGSANRDGEEESDGDDYNKDEETDDESVMRVHKSGYFGKMIHNEDEEDEEDEREIRDSDMLEGSNDDDVVDDVDDVTSVDADANNNNDNDNNNNRSNNNESENENENTDGDNENNENRKDEDEDKSGMEMKLQEEMGKEKEMEIESGKESQNEIGHDIENKNKNENENDNDNDKENEDEGSNNQEQTPIKEAAEDQSDPKVTDRNKESSRVQKSVNLGGWRPDTSAARSGFLQETAKKAPPGYVYDENGELVNLTPSSMKSRMVSTYSEAGSSWNPFPSNGGHDDLQTIRDTKTIYDNQTIYNVPGLIINNKSLPPLPDLNSEAQLANPSVGNEGSGPDARTMSPSTGAVLPKESEKDKTPVQNSRLTSDSSKEPEKKGGSSTRKKSSASISIQRLPVIKGSSSVPVLDLNKVIGSRDSHARKIQELQNYYDQLLVHDTGIRTWIEASLKSSAKPEKNYLFQQYKDSKHVKDAYANADELSKKHTVTNTVASVNQNVSQLKKKVFSHPIKTRGLFASIGKKKL